LQDEKTAGKPHPTIADFHDVDSSDSSFLITYLDAVNRGAGNDKRRSYEALQLAEGMRVLELGCGTGDDVRAIAQIVGPRGRVIGVDSSAAMIAEAQARGTPSNVEFLQARADALPFEAASFDACRAERIFQHLSNPEIAASELRRVLRIDGRAFVLDPDWETLMIAGADITITRRMTRALADRLAYPLAGRNALALLRRAGFRCVITAPLVAAPTLAAAHDLFLTSAIDSAIAAGTVTTEEAATWLRALAEAEQRGEFFCAIMSVATLAKDTFELSDVPSVQAWR